MSKAGGDVERITGELRDSQLHVVGAVAEKA